MFKEAKVRNPINVKPTKLAIARKAYLEYYYGWLRCQARPIELRNFKPYNRDSRHKYTVYYLGSFRICLKKLKY